MVVEVVTGVATVDGSGLKSSDVTMKKYLIGFFAVKTSAQVACEVFSERHSESSEYTKLHTIKKDFK